VVRINKKALNYNKGCEFYDLIKEKDQFIGIEKF
jgi:hypothetical protein